MNKRNTYTLNLNIPAAEIHEHHTHHCSVIHLWRRCVAHVGPLVTIRSHAYRAPWLVAGAPPPAWFPAAVRSYRPHPEALALGLITAHHDGGGRVYLSGDGAMIAADTPVLIIEAETTLIQRAAWAVDLLRQSGLPAEAEALASKVAQATADMVQSQALAARLISPSLDRAHGMVTAHAMVAAAEGRTGPPTPGSIPWARVADVLAGVL